MCALSLLSIIVSTSISPYKQRLTGGVVVLCDVASIGTLRARAHSGGIGWVVVQRGNEGVGELLLSNLKRKKNKFVSKKKSVQ